MTFVLKDFEELKKHFKDTVRIILERVNQDAKDGNVKKLENLPSPRKEELQFLISVIEVLDERASHAKHKNTKQFALTLYGAMLLIAKDVELNLSSIKMEKKENSILWKRLMEAMGISDATKPQAHQFTEFHEAINKFLPLIFVDHDSRKGLAPKHPLMSLPLDKLSVFVTTSYRLEKESRFAEVAELVELAKHGIRGESKPNAKEFKSQEVNPKILAKFANWDALRTELHDLKIKELANKNAANVNDLSTLRAAQLSFLSSIEKQLSEAKGIKDEDKITILAGAMYIVRGQIAVEYSKNPLSASDIKNSKIHTGLTGILKAKEESLEDIELLISAANHYIHFMTIEANTKVEPNKAPKAEASKAETSKDGKAEAAAPKEEYKDSIRKVHLFSDIKDFHLADTLTLIQSMIHTCRKGALDRCINKVLADEEAKAAEAKPNKGLFGGFFTRSKKLADDEDEEESAEAVAAASSTEKKEVEKTAPAPTH